MAQLHRHGGVHLEADDRAAAAPLEHALELANKILGFFLDLDLGVADDPEGALPFDGVAREEARNEQAVACSRVTSRTGPPSGGDGRRMNLSTFCGTRMSAFIALPSLWRIRCRAIEKPRLGMKGNGWRVDRERVSTGKMCRRK